MKRWEFNGEEKNVFGITLKQIRATDRFTLKCGITIEAGENGGWIEGEKNLSDNAWVSDNARVYGNALVLGNALVSDNARVYGNAQVFDNARVYGNALVSGNARVYGNALVSGNAHYFQIGPAGSRNDYTTFTRNKAGTIFVSCGCFYGTIDEFRERVKKTHGDNKHAKVYLAAADLAELQIDTIPIEDEPKEET